MTLPYLCIYIYAIIPPLKRIWTFIWINLNSYNARTVFIKLDLNWSHVSLKKFFPIIYKCKNSFPSCVTHFDWMIDYLLFYVPLKDFSFIWRHHHYRWRAAKFRPMLGTQGLWAWRDLYRATPTVTQDLGSSGLIQRTSLISRLLRHAWGYRGPILTRILRGPHFDSRGP
jgi:hypothetical protein